jgi:hypothetical protein
VLPVLDDAPGRLQTIPDPLPGGSEFSAALRHTESWDEDDKQPTETGKTEILLEGHPVALIWSDQFARRRVTSNERLIKAIMMLANDRDK